MTIDLTSLFLNDLDCSLATEIVLRTLITFTLILFFLRFSGKKGVKQLSFFEVAIIIGLGSAAGDPIEISDHNAESRDLLFLIPISEKGALCVNQKEKALTI